MLTTLLWLRRDLRLHDHAALAHALVGPGQVQPVFIFDTDILKRFTRRDDPRLTFIAETLIHLHAQLRAKGGGLLVAYGRPQHIIPKLAQMINAREVVASEDYEPGTRMRDKEVAALLGTIPLTLICDHLLLPPTQVLKDDGAPYKVYTPYARAWRAALTPENLHSYHYDNKEHYATIALDADFLLPVDKDAEALLAPCGYSPAPLGEWRPQEGTKRLEVFINYGLNNYAECRDYPALHGTSKLSPYLRFGLLSVRECYRAAYEQRHSDKWLSELIWREFYAMILYHYPESATMEWNPAYRGLAWKTNGRKLQAWKDGMTGYPLIDAAMRELRDTGWMHNRARMIVASFLTKDLHIDWRAGEEHFAQYLMDYELASNVGGWQWAASTGTDAQPYFRVFNPILQSKKFDPEGEYIRRYVPELKHLNSKEVHMPKERPEGYPSPIVDHDEARKYAILMYNNR